MTSPFKFNTTDFGPEQEGLMLTCFASQTEYFTQGQKYPIGIGRTGDPYLTTDCGMKIHQTSSLFITKPPLPPKQPKVGEVWSLMVHRQFAAFHEDTLYYIVKIEDGKVHHKVCKPKQPVAFWTDYVFTAPIDRFIEQHNFVF